MPLKKCEEGKKSGWKWGDNGKCYTGPDAKKQAIKQGIAIEGPSKFLDVVRAEKISFLDDDYETIDDEIASLGFKLGDRLAYTISLRAMNILT